ncbi:hypothetical protein GUITHDRAFT_138411 [Guillardia theta CCMP2712]|uniref:LrgB-like protein n=1 Tax=Guillardia theta (strain CCMP2712) TaxID=905079 RepID=L1JDH7_GUITC|nr:hypothetical protein GUITHDRAFT_138411 [Guillardia theta CCMP2712]EKX46332.1 hypothetical protein GUITHDRAFT_138411 [Guillardia theta CCMP2712]|eukprot:XP_005833312.1 hypothetical protein GUITHDRAFT_138411 [Guillardia theta CCMP2712]
MSARSRELQSPESVLCIQFIIASWPLYSSQTCQATSSDSSGDGSTQNLPSMMVKQVSKLLDSVPSVAVLILLNTLTIKVFKKFGVTVIPPPLFGMFSLFAFLLAIPETAASKVVKFFNPGVTLLNRFLPLFYTPALVVLPLPAIVCVIFASYSSTAFVTTGLQSLAKGGEAELETSAPKTFSPFLERLWAVATAVTFAGAVASPTTLPIFMFSATLFAFIAGNRLSYVLPKAVNNSWHYLMTAFVLVNAMFAVYGAVVGKAQFDLLRAYLMPGAGIFAAPGNIIMYFLAPAIWSFAFGLYGRRKTLFPNWLPIIGGSFWSAFSGVFMIAFFSKLFGASEILRLAVLPRGTAALAVIQAGYIGASTAFVTAATVITGMLGANFGKTILDGLKVKSSCARGVATGGAAFTLGTAALAKDDPSAFPFGALGMALMSTWATLLYTVTPVRNAIMSTAGLTPPGIEQSAQRTVKKAAPAPKKTIAFTAGPDVKVQREM